MTRLTVTVLIVLATSITNLTVTAHQAAAADESGQWQDDVELIAAEDAPEEEQDEQEEDESQDEQEEDESQDDDDDVELIAVEAEPDDEDEDEQEQEEQDEQEDDESQDDDDDVELLAAKADPDEEDEEEQEQQEQEGQEEYEDDESQDDVELLAAKSKGKVKKAATKAKKAVKKAKKAAKKVKKAVKKPKKKKKVSKIAKGKYAKFLVLKGSKEKTVGGLTAKDLMKNKYGRTVSKKKSANSKKHPWMAAVQAARSALKIKGFSLIKKGSPLYAKAKSLYKPKEEMLSADVISGTAAALMGLFVGFGLGFIALRSRRRVPAELCEPMLPSA